VEEEKGIHLTDRAYLVVVRLSSAQDVSTIDLNCGCPKRFSVHGGMGAALMDEPEKLCGVRSCIDSMLEQHFFFAFFFFFERHDSPTGSGITYLVSTTLFFFFSDLCRSSAIWLSTLVCLSVARFVFFLIVKRLSS